MASDAKVGYSSENHVIIDIPEQNDTAPGIAGSFPNIDNLEYFPEKVLLQIFSKLNDVDLLALSDCSNRFEGIAKFEFKLKYTNKYFVFDGETRSKRKIYEELFHRFGHYANIKAIEAKNIQNIDRNHWLPKLLRKYTQLTKLAFCQCSFKKIRFFLLQHIHLTHLTIRMVFWKGALLLPRYRDLKVLELENNNYRGFIKDKTMNTILRNNPTLETLNLNRCGRIVSICSIAKYLRHLKELNLIYSMKDDWEISKKTMDLVANSLKHLEALSLTIRNDGHIRLIHQLAANCKNLKQLKLHHNRFDRLIASDEIIEAASRFQTIESLELVHLRNFDSIKTLVEYLPNFHQLRHLKLFMDTPQRSSTFIPSLSNKLPSLKTIEISSWNNAKLNWPMFFLSTAIFKEIINTARSPPRCRIELEDFHRNFGFATNKKIVWCKKRSHWITNDSIFFSFDLVFLFFGIIFVLFYEILIYCYLHLHDYIFG